MSSLAALALLAGGLVLVVAGAELLLDGLLGSAARLGVSAFTVTVIVSGFELENLAAGIAANAKGLPGAAAGTFLGGTTFLAIAVAGLGAVISPLRAELSPGALLWTAASPLPLLAMSAGGEVSRVDGALLVVWFGVAIVGLARSGREVLGEVSARRRGRPLVRCAGARVGLSAGAVGRPESRTSGHRGSRHVHARSGRAPGVSSRLLLATASPGRCARRLKILQPRDKMGPYWDHGFRAVVS